MKINIHHDGHGAGMYLCRSVNTYVHKTLILRRFAVVFMFATAVMFAKFAAVAQSTKKDVFFGGFAFSGEVRDVDKNFPISSSINKPTDDETPLLGRLAREFFKKNKDRFSQMNLQFGLASKPNLVLALALTDEKVLREEFSDFHKLVIQLGFEVLILDFQTLEVVS